MRCLEGRGTCGTDLVVGVDQDDVVVHHNARQADDAHTDHNDAKRLTVDQ